MRRWPGAHPCSDKPVACWAVSAPPGTNRAMRGAYGRPGHSPPGKAQGRAQAQLSWGAARCRARWSGRGMARAGARTGLAGAQGAGARTGRGKICAPDGGAGRSKIVGGALGPRTMSCRDKESSPCRQPTTLVTCRAFSFATVSFPWSNLSKSTFNTTAQFLVEFWGAGSGLAVEYEFEYLVRNQNSR